MRFVVFFFFQAEDGIRDIGVTGVQTCALPIFFQRGAASWSRLAEILDSRPAVASANALRTLPPAGAGRSVEFRNVSFHYPTPRSEERRVGKEWRSRWSAYH